MGADEPSSAPGRSIDENAIFRSLHAAYPDALLVVDKEGQIVLANPAAASLLGYAMDELIGMAIDELVPAASRSRHASYRQAYARNPRTRPMGTQMELAARRKDGSEVTVEIALSPLQSEGEQLVVASIRDIGAYPRVQQAIERARYSERLAELGHVAVDARERRVLLDRVPVVVVEALHADSTAVFLLEPGGNHLRIASRAGPLAGEVVGTVVANRPDTPAGFVLSRGSPVTIADFAAEQRFKVAPGDVDAGLRVGVGVPVSDRGRIIGALLVGSRRAQPFGAEEIRFLESVSSLLATSLQRAASEEALAHSQQLESVGQLTGGIAHDFNNLLTVIQGNLQVLEESPALSNDAQSRQVVDAAMRAARRGAELTGKLLAFSRRQLLQPAPTDVGALLRSLADMLGRTLDQRIRIELDITGRPVCLADPAQLEAALLNIAINARDAMPDGGTIAFRAEPRTLPPEAEEGPEPERAADGYVAISIHDTGTGMTDEVKEHAFEPFFTTKQAGRGTGLGLSTVYGFIKQSRGAIDLSSEQGAGTTITLYMPAVAAGTAAHVEPAQHDAVRRGLRVLLVEDDAEVRSVVRGFLERIGCTVAAAADAEQALGMLGAKAPFDVLVSDIALGPGMRGTELAARAQAATTDLGVVLMSGFSAELLDADRDAPARWELLRKPFSRADIARAIAAVSRR